MTAHNASRTAGTKRKSGELVFGIVRGGNGLRPFEKCAASRIG
jgi:hypothetical protein